MLVAFLQKELGQVDRKPQPEILSVVLSLGLG